MLTRLGQSLAWKIFPWAHFSLKLNSGLRISLMNRADFPILQEIFIEQSYTPFLAALPEIRTWVDIGCNCGLFTFFLEDWARNLQWKGPRRAILIDPNRYALRTVRESLRLNQLTSAFQVLEGAVAGREQQVDFYESKSTYKSSVFKLKSSEKSRRVPVIDLNHTTAGWPALDLVKVDIEGGEKLLLENWMPWLQKARFLLVEWHEPHLGGRALDAACKQAGFKLVVVHPPSYLKLKPGDPLDFEIGSGLWFNPNWKNGPVA